ncbi:MAG: hypothetical protein FWD61_13610 [Phycisphaerales bacterium]|nr:hypothetical protein [Phycisphaerales bacterium]
MAEVLKVGREWEIVWTITDRRLATAYGNPGVAVFGTPGMVEMMEQAAVECVLPCLEEGQGTVGIKVDVEHTASTPVGMKVWCAARVTAIDGRKISFEMEARNEVEVIGRGKQQRVVVGLGRFVEKATQKKLEIRNLKFE